MARDKSKREKSNTSSSNPTEPKERVMSGLTAEQIAALLGKTRQKGVYIAYLNQFLESGEAGVCVNEQWVDLRDKKDTTLKQGFESAKENKEAKEGSEFVKVISNDGKVYLINLQAAGVAADSEREAAAA